MTAQFLNFKSTQIGEHHLFTGKKSQYRRISHIPILLKILTHEYKDEKYILTTYPLCHIYSHS